MGVHLNWPRIDEIQAGRCNRLYARNGVKFYVRGQYWQVHFPPQPPSGYRPGMTLRLGIQERSFAVEVERAAFREAIGELLGNVELQVLPDELAVALLTEICDRALQDLSAYLGTSVRITKVEVHTIFPLLKLRDSQIVPFILKGPNEVISGRLLFQSEGWGMLFAFLARGELDRLKPWLDLPHKLSLIAGITHLRSSEVQALEQGDVVLLDTAFPKDQVGCLLPNRKLWRAGGKQKLILEELVDRSHEMQANQVSDPFDPILEMIFEINRREISLQKLSELSLGSVIETGVSLKQGIKILVNGANVGRGEIVALGNKLAVRILELKNRAPLPSEEVV